MIQSPQPFIVTVVEAPSHTTNIGDVVLGALGLAGVLALAAVALGVVVAAGLILWRRYHPPDAEHPPSVTSMTPLHPPSSPVR
jgi:hypothetical protein